MGRTRTRVVFPVCMLPLALLVASPAAAARASVQGYQTIDLGTFHGSGTVARDVNDRGVVVGRYGAYHPAAWYPRTGWHDLPLLRGDDEGYAFAINDAGTIAGVSGPPDLPNAPVIWRGGQVHAVPLPDTLVFGEATSINDAGDVAGDAFAADPDADPYLFPFVWRAHKGVQVLPVLAGYDGCWLKREAHMLNDHRELVGTCFRSAIDGSLSTTAFLWREGHGMVALDTGGWPNSEAAGITNRGQVVGLVDDGNFAFSRPVVWYQGHREYLPSPSPAPTGFSLVTNLNSAGEFAVCSASPAGDATAWTGTDFETLIPPSGMVADGVTSVANDGEISGYGIVRDGAVHALLFIPSAPGP